MDSDKDSANLEKAKVFFTKDISPEGIKRVYSYVNANIQGRVAIKVHTGEPKGPNIIPPAWVREFRDSVENSKIVECNVYYPSLRMLTAFHKLTLLINGWKLDEVDIMDAGGSAVLPIRDGKWLENIAVGKNLLDYDSLIALTHFKGHTMGGYGGSLKNIAIGCASRKGKGQLHKGKGLHFFTKSDLMEHMVEGFSAVQDYFKKNLAYINVLRRMSVDCDCVGIMAKNPELEDLGILASNDILAIDKASIDLVYNYSEKEGSTNKPLIERIESREGLRQITYMQERNMGNIDYELVSIDK